ncbi:lipolytic protein G-D-S-L family [Crinalium epipsammum PCC 9333]|uniref:Lipolytic protein G-D-S-L family n=1 Tax=Crinalium epipsammum PCC 9333 TaxID=1173022 RepID=K9VZK4_9CYAN|nr:GDSL-type esterase/lipase family protein [Crinalium epipsammum]AFZ13416.1 lipolytic protein G-D-S-L family [Crinalium epipsammum PCC 9333]
MQTLASPTVKRYPQSNVHPLKIVVIGDSIVYGFGDFEGGGWVERLRRNWMMPDSPGHVIYNLGVRGDGVLQVSQRLEQEFRNRGELRNRVPDAIALSVGVNDAARLGRTSGRYFTDFGVFQQEISQLLDRAKQLCPVYFVGMVPVDESKMPFLDCFYYNHEDQYRYKEATRLACEARNIPYLDIFDLWIERGTDWCREQMCADGLHPNSSGYQALLKDVLNWQPITQLANSSLITA